MPYCKVEFQTDGDPANINDPANGPYFLSDASTGARLGEEEGPTFRTNAPSQSEGVFSGLRIADRSGRVGEMLGFCSTDANPYVVKIRIAPDGRYDLQFPPDRFFVTRNEGGLATVTPTAIPAATETPTTTATPKPTEIATAIPTPAATSTVNADATTQAELRDLRDEVGALGTAQAEGFNALQQASQRTATISISVGDIPNIPQEPLIAVGAGGTVLAILGLGMLLHASAIRARNKSSSATTKPL